MKKTPKGFTLLEIIIVLFLVTLMTGLSAVFFSNFLPSTKFHAAGREMSAMIRHARSLARMNMETQTFVVDLDNKTYGIEGRSTKQIPQDSLIKVIDPVSGEMIQGTGAGSFSDPLSHIIPNGVHRGILHCESGSFCP